MRIIRTDEVWSGRVVLDRDVQIAPGVTVTVEPGTIVEGRGRTLEVFGTIEAIGRIDRPILFDTVWLELGRHPDAENVVRARDIQVDGGGFLTFRSTAVSGHVSVERGLFTATGQYTHLRYLDGDSRIADSVFLSAQGVSVGTRETFRFEDNLVWNQRPWFGEAFGLSVFTTTGGTVISSGNAFLSANLPAIVSAGPVAAPVSDGDYFAGGAGNGIVDAADDLARGTVSVVRPLAGPPVGMPTLVRSYTTIDLPPSVLEDVTLLGNENAAVTGNPLANRLVGNAGANRLDGRDGADTLLGGAGDDTLDGGGDNDSLAGGAGRDRLDGAAGADALDGEAGRDTLSGGEGADRLEGGGGDDSLAGGAGFDLLLGGDGADVIAGGGGNDRADGGDGGDRLDGNVGRDRLDGGAGADTLDGGPHRDTLDGGGDSDMLSGSGGDDTLLGGVGRDRLEGGARNDSLAGGAHRDTLDGGAHRDILDGGGGNDVLFGGRGTDTLFGGSNRDRLDGGHHDDTLSGEGHGDRLDGGHGNDRLSGGGGRDRLDGGSGDDRLDGGGQPDLLIGGLGDDVLLGGAGADTFAFPEAGFGRDVIRDYDPGRDRIDLAGSALGPGDLAISFANGNAIVSVAGTGDAIVVVGAAGALGLPDLAF